MRKISLVLGSALLLCLSTALPALAGSELPSPSPSVKGEVIHAGGTAFTGANVIPWVIAVVALVVAGLGLLALSRRRSTV